jgi:hypothetical protein
MSATWISIVAAVGVAALVLVGLMLIGRARALGRPLPYAPTDGTFRVRSASLEGDEALFEIDCARSRLSLGVAPTTVSMNGRTRPRWRLIRRGALPGMRHLSFSDGPVRRKVALWVGGECEEAREHWAWPLPELLFEAFGWPEECWTLRSVDRVVLYIDGQRVAAVGEPVPRGGAPRPPEPGVD